MNPRHFIFSIALAAVAALPGCDHGSAPPQKPALPAIKAPIVRAHRGEITRSITLPGNVMAWQQATLFAKVAGYLKTITIDKGDEVKAGALIADIEVPELIADLARSKAIAEVAAIDFKRTSDAQKKAPDLVIAQTVDASRGKFEVAQANLEHDQTLLGFTKITAPFDGVITRRFVDPGAFIPVATGGSAGQSAAIVTLADFGTVRVNTAVPEPEVPFVKAETPVQITFQELPGKNFSGAVTRIAYALDEATRTMIAEVDLPNEQREMRPGMYAIVKFGVERHADALLLPADAVLVEKSGKSAFVLTPENKAKKTPLKTGFEDGTSVEILEGVSPDQPVIAFGKQTIQDGQPVQVIEAK